MRLFLFLSIFLFSIGVFAQTEVNASEFGDLPTASQEVALPWQVPMDEVMNCVNPGGSCNGTLPCCDSYNNACVRGRCQRVTGDGFYDENLRN